MTASPQSSNSLTAAFPSFRSVSPLPSLLRSAAASSSSSLSSLFQFTSAEIDPQYSTSDEVRSHQSIITQAFSPTVAVIASRECEEVIHEKGFTNFLDLIRPFGDRVQGKVNIRDSQALSIPVEDFSMKFVDFQLLAQSTTNGREEHGPYAPKRTTPAYISGGDLAAIERVLEGYAEEANTEYEEGSEGSGAGLYSYFLRKVLSGMPLSAHETFSHPVACVLAVSTRHPEPIDALLGLYNTTNNAPIPRYIDAGFLRYYVLIHDEDKDDIDKSNTILEKMKRSLGLHCTLLRLSSTPSKDTTPLSKSIWLSAGEELLSLSNPTPLPNISSFDREALIKFTRDLATQSIIPHMERCISTWNDQIASYRRGLAGRVFTASRRLFSSSSRSATPTSGTGNYDVSSSSYPPATPEAQMRKLADYAFMLRDFRLAHSTYDIVRKDFVNDKAWKYAAGAQEMTAMSMLLLQSPLTQSKRSETLEPLLDSALYSYTARSSAPYCSLRTILLAIELLTLKGGSAPDDAVKWATKALSSGSLGDIGTCLLVERIASCYKVMFPRRRRKMALWSMLACESWSGVGCKVFAVKCLKDAVRVYTSVQGMDRIHAHLSSLMENLGVKQNDNEEKEGEVVDMQEAEEVPQQLQSQQETPQTQEEQPDKIELVASSS